MYGQKEGEVIWLTRTGRPLKSENEKKSVRLEIRLTQQEDEMLTELSKKQGLSKTDTIIKAISLLAEQN